jgi:hypothetical protein
MNTKYILAGTIAVDKYDQYDYKGVADAIANHDGDLLEISSLDEIQQLLSQIEGWDAFITISLEDRNKIKS